MKLKPRQYQLDAAKSAWDSWAEGHRSIKLVMATGLGKSVTLTHIIDGWDIRTDLRIMVLAHKRKLVNQLHAHIARLKKDWIGVEMAEKKSEGFEPIIVGTIQTISARLDRYDPLDFGLVIVDESHHDSSVSSQYNKLKEWASRNPQMKRLGTTATTLRADGVGFEDRYDHIAYRYDLLDAINDGYLVRPETYIISLKGLKFDSLRVGFSDVAVGDLLTESEQTILELAAKVVKFVGKRKCLIFMPNKRTCELLCEAIRNHPDFLCPEEACDYIHSSRHKNHKERFFDNIDNGTIQIGIGCDMLIEGFDWPECEDVIVAKPISEKAQSRLLQMVGRGTRPTKAIADGLGLCETAEQRKKMIAESSKPSLRVLDLVGFTNKHSFYLTPSLSGKIVKKEVYNEIAKIAEDLPEAVSFEELERQAEANLAAEEKRLAEEQRRLHQEHLQIFARAEIDARKAAGMNPSESAFAERYDKVDELPTVDQINFLMKRGLYEPGMTRQQARRLQASIYHDEVADWQKKIFSERLPLYDPSHLDYYQATAIIKLMDARGWTGIPPKDLSDLVSIKQSREDRRYRVYIADPTTGQKVLVHDPIIMSGIAKFVAARTARGRKR
jgi:superfamily II DNA or RNA helicase